MKLISGAKTREQYFLSFLEDPKCEAEVENYSSSITTLSLFSCHFVSLFGIVAAKVEF